MTFELYRIELPKLVFSNGNGLSLNRGHPKLEMPKEELAVADNFKLIWSPLRLKLVQTFRAKWRRTEGWVALEDGRVWVCSASLLLTHLYPGFFWGGILVSGCLYLVSPSAAAPGSLGPAAGLPASPGVPLSTPPNTTHTTVSWGKQPDPSKSSFSRGDSR